MSNWKNYNNGVLPKTVYSVPAVTPKIENLFEELTKENPYVKKQQVFELNEGLITLSVAWNRFRNLRNAHDRSTYGLQIESMTSKDLFEFVSEEDRSIAEQIKNYYSKKFMLLKLKNINFTGYREDLNELIHGDDKKVTDDQFALVYYLPEFYEYDVEFDNLVLEHNKEVTRVKNTGIVVGSQEKNIKLLKTFQIRRKRFRRTELWFTDDDKNLINLNTDLNNPLLSLLELHSQEPLKVNGFFGTRKRDDYEYFEMSNFKFV